MPIRPGISLVWSAVALLLAACGGGGGGGGSGAGGSGPASIRAEPASVNLETNRTDVVQRPLRLIVQADEVDVDLAPGAPDIQGVDVFLDFVNDTELSGALQGNPNGVPRGTQQTTLRFTARRGLNTAFVDLPVRFDVLQPFSVSTSGALSFNGIEGAPATEIPVEVSGEVLGDRVNWQLLSELPWLTVSPGTGTGDAQLTFTADASGLPLGTNAGNVRVTETESGTETTLPAEYVLRPARLVVTPMPQIDLTIDVDTSLAGLGTTVSVGSEVPDLDPAKAVTWTAVPTAGSGWLRADPPSAPSVPVLNVAILPNPSELTNRAPGSEFGRQIEFQYTNGAGVPLSIPLFGRLDYHLPLVRGIWPPVVDPNQQTTVIAGYEEFTPRLEAGVRIGGQSPVSVALTNAQQARLLTPALAAGEYEVTVPNAAGIDRSYGTLVVRSPVAIPAGAIESAGAKSRLLHDPVANALYAVDRVGGRLLRYEFDGSAWVASAPRVLPGIQDASLSIAADRVFAITGSALHAASLRNTAEGFSAIATEFPDLLGPTCGEPSALSALVDARLVVHATLTAGCDLATGSVWDEIRGRFFPDASGGLAVPGTVVAESAPFRTSAVYGWTRPNGRGDVALVGTRGSTTFTFEVGPEIFALSQADLSSLVLINDELLYQTSGTPLPGRVPRGDAAALSVIGDRVYSYVSRGVLGGEINVYDITATPAGGVYPQVATIPVPTDIGVPVTLDQTERRRSIAVRLSTDGRILFVSGTARIAVIPVGGV